MGTKLLGENSLIMNRMHFKMTLWLLIITSTFYIIITWKFKCIRSIVEESKDNTSFSIYLYPHLKSTWFS